MQRTVFFVSDGTGITAETLGHTLLTQFDNVELRQITIPFIDTQEKAAAALNTINRAGEEDGCRPIVFSTLVASPIQAHVARSNALVMDLFSVFIKPLENELSSVSTHTPGRSHGVVDAASYNVRIAAVDFALQHDDGATTGHLKEADIILMGVSRSGKTPTCLYLAMQFGIRAANYPIIDDDLDRESLPKSLVPYRNRLFGLTIDPERLHQIRRERRPNSRYASFAQCRREVQVVEEMFCRERLQFMDTGNVSIEEIASKLLQQTGLRRRLF